MSRHVTLVNANEMRPPVAPLALDYLGAALERSGWTPCLLDLTWAVDPAQAVAEHFRDAAPLLIGLTVRNTDDCYMAGRYSCLDHAQATVRLLREHSDAPLVLGGCGFSVMPAALLDKLGADWGIAGEGEQALGALADALARGEYPRDIPGLVWREGDMVRRNPPAAADLAALDLAPRALVDNARYWREGGQGGFETTRGCDGACVYCADPIAKGRRVRLRDPANVARELDNLRAQGVGHLHTCDSEFNVPRDHAVAVCEAICARGLAERIRWWAYCAPGDFDDELARAMVRAGCAGINFGADHGCDEQLARLGRSHRVADIERAARLCHEHAIVCMFDLLFGAPDDTREGVRTTLELMKRLAPDRVGISLGVRLYPGTALARDVARGPLAKQPGLHGELEDNEALLMPIFYLDPALGPDIAPFIREQVGGDRRFLCPDPEADLTDYNYRENPTLVEAIRAGHRGAYWDILRRLEEGLGPV